MYALIDSMGIVMDFFKTRSEAESAVWEFGTNVYEIICVEDVTYRGYNLT